jgi:putative ATP-binding cassette transporter
VEVVEILFREAPEAWKRTLVVAGIAGVGNAAILGIINRGANIASTDSSLVNLRLLLLFGFAMLAFWMGKRYALIRSSVIVEHMLKDRLVRVFGKIRHADLEVVEALGHGELYTRITQNTNVVSQSGLILVNAAQQSFVLVFCLLYIAWLSKAAFLVTITIIGVGVVVYSRHAQSLQELLRSLTNREAELIDTLAHMVDGFKEIRLNRKKADSVFKTFTGVSEAVRDLKIEAQISSIVDVMFSDMFFYTLLCIVVFILPRFSPTYGAVVLMTTSAILFIIGPLSMVVQAMPIFARAKSALSNLRSLEDRLDQESNGEKIAVAPNAPPFHGFRAISLDGVCFSYRSGDGSEGFSVGPLNLRIERGEILFIVGGNGSGKTTAMKLITGLYLPRNGIVRVDREVLDRSNVQRYRELIGTVFAQFHLFDRLYGMEDVDESRVHTLLEEMELTHKTRFENGRFTHVHLSTGERKRLALVVCLIEDKEILVFDEWAADQDPHFRKYFYQVILQRLKAQGKTIIAVTHDDRYWDVADRVVKMEYGCIADEVRNR